jgi:hypothetical protein
LVVTPYGYTTRERDRSSHQGHDAAFTPAREDLVDDLELGLVKHLSDEARGLFLVDGPELLVGRGYWEDAVRWFQSHSANIFGLEGFDFPGFDTNGRYLKPRLDYIADFSRQDGATDPADAALRLLAEWESAKDRPQFVTFVLGPNVGSN